GSVPDAGRCGRTPPTPSPSRRTRLTVHRGAPSGERPVLAPVTATPQGRGELRDQPRRTRTRLTARRGR
ncbi:hypothetical protein ABK046_42695, partial [Streptomyces caeruleatus]